MNFNLQNARVHLHKHAQNEQMHVVHLHLGFLFKGKETKLEAHYQCQETHYQCQEMPPYLPTACNRLKRLVP